MGFWSYYFFAKLLMYGGGFIGFHLLENLLFALFTMLPTRHWALRAAKQLIAVPTATALLYHDAWLPPWRRIVAQSDQLSDFSLPYLVELAQRFVNLQLLLGLLVLLGVYWLLSRKLRLSSFAVLGILISPWLGVLTGVRAPLSEAPAAGASADSLTAAGVDPVRDLDATLTAFYERERQRRVRLVSVAGQEQPYDVLVLQVCSLAWDDLEYVGQRQNPLLERFDLRFDNFSAAASYSGPAAIRLLRATCGQPQHEALYQPADPGCYLMENLQAAGYSAQWAMNHDGEFGDMATDIAERGQVGAELFPLTGLAPALKSFDGSDYYSDYEVLSAWWRQRLQQDASRVALYYNTGTLHDGNRFLDGSRQNAQDSYRRRAQRLFDDLGRFFDELEASGRRVIVIMVPEHGSNVRGDRMQISGLREVPSPAIGLVPAGVKVIGRSAPSAPLRLSQPASYLAIGTLLAGFLAADPYAEDAAPLSEYARDLPQTEYVAENDGVVVMRAGGRYWMRSVDGRWAEYQSGR